MPDSEGPYLSMAVLCEKVLQEASGVPSIIRVVDRVLITMPPPPVIISATLPAPEQPDPQINLTIALMFKAGKFRGDRNLTVRLTAPSGLRHPETTLPLLFEGDDDRGINVFLPFVLVAHELGIYWFDLDLGEELIARIPLRIVNQQISVSTPPVL